jgi:hypothetical protein
VSTIDVDRADGSAVIRAFERLAAEAARPEAPADRMLEAAAMGIALAVLGLVERAVDRDRVASRARKALLAAGALRAASADEDALDALELALEQARRGVSLLTGGPSSILDGAPSLEPTPRELARLVAGELDGHAAADVATRLHRSGARERYAALLPTGSADDVRVRLAADSAPVIRDPALGRALGSAELGRVSLEAYAFEAAVVAIYAEPAVAISLASIDAALERRPIEVVGYLELRVVGDPETLTLTLTDGEASVRWSLRLR